LQSNVFASKPVWYEILRLAFGPHAQSHNSMQQPQPCNSRLGGRLELRWHLRIKYQVDIPNRNFNRFTDLNQAAPVKILVSIQLWWPPPRNDGVICILIRLYDPSTIRTECIARIGMNAGVHRTCSMKLLVVVGSSRSRRFVHVYCHWTLLTNGLCTNCDPWPG
jgi:hypothetical protein